MILPIRQGGSVREVVVLFILAKRKLSRGYDSIWCGLVQQIIHKRLHANRNLFPSITFVLQLLRPVFKSEKASLCLIF